jgi:hypothetical protein
MARMTIQAGAIYLPAHGSDIRADLVARVVPERDRRLGSLVVVVNGSPFDGDRASRDNIQGLLTAAAAGVPIPWPVAWRGADNITRPLDAATAAAVAGSILGAVQAVYVASWRLKDETIPGLSDAAAAEFDVAADAHWMS